MISKLYSDIRALRNKAEKYHFDTVCFTSAENVHKGLEKVYEGAFDIMHTIAETIIVSINQELVPCEDEVAKETDIVTWKETGDLGEIVEEIEKDIRFIIDEFYEEIKKEKNLVSQNVLMELTVKMTKLRDIIHSLPITWKL